MGRLIRAMRRRSPLRNLSLGFTILVAQAAHSQQTITILQAEAQIPDAPEAQNSPQAAPNAVAPGTQSTPTVNTTGLIRGVVTDRDGAVYQGVLITLIRPGTPSASIPTDSDGRFIFPDLSPGPFEIAVESNGFAGQKITGKLHAGESYSIPTIVLLISNATSNVQVIASRYEIAEEELHAEEQQRVFGVIPNFYVVYAPNAPPLNARQKFHLAWRTAIDPVSFLAAGAAAGLQQADDDFKGYGQGSQGYAKRFGASYADDVIGNLLGGAILPSLFKQDPRYFYKGTGTKRARALYAIANAVICKGDNGHWQFNYSGIGGSLAAGGISNLYYPARDRNGISLTITNTLTGIGGNALGNLFQEFLVKKLTPKLPNYNQSKP